MKEIAFQAGLSLATIDRVLHDRAGVRASTKLRVQAAVTELERQYGAARLPGRRISLDVVMEAPTRFLASVRQAFEAELPSMRPAQISARFHTSEQMTDADITKLLRAIRRRGSHGVVLKARQSSAVADAARRLMAAGIPVLTFVTDLPPECRLAYVGIDNRAAGEAAAWLMGHMLGGRRCDVLTTLSSAMFSGEDTREAAFREAMASRFPEINVVRVSEGMGLRRGTRLRVAEALEENAAIEAVYSVGGGNRAILEAFEAARRTCRVFAGHDLDRANRSLLAEERLTFVLHHDLRQDARTVCQTILRHHRMLSDDVPLLSSRFEIVTPPGPDGWAH